MAAPTRLQIEAAFALPTYRVDIWDTYLGAGYWHQIPNASVVSLSGSVESTGNQDNGLSFGTSVAPSASVQTENIVFTSTLLISNVFWIGTRMRISFGFSTSDLVVQMVGVIKDIQVEDNTVTFNIVGLVDYIEQTKVFTDVQYHVPIASKTTIASVEDPSNPSYDAGLINRAFWESGGRPFEQKDLNYTENSAGFKFWYSCEQALFGPEYAWFEGENLADELYTLARSAGGQIYQDAQGIMRYVQPLSLGDVSNYGGTYYTFTDAVFNGFNQKITTAEKVGTVTAKFTRRYIAPLQTIYEDKTAHFFKPNETKVLEFNTQLPIWEYVNLVPFNSITATANMKAQLIDGHDITPGINDVTLSAKKVTISIWNPSATVPMHLYSVKLQGKPLAAAPELQVSIGSGLPVRNVEDNVYIQTETHATRLINLIYAFYYDARPIITLDNVQFDPDRFVGEIVKVQSTYNRLWTGSSWTNDNTLYRIIKIAHDGTGTSMTIDLVSVAGIPARQSMFIIGTSYTGTDNRSLSY